MTKQPTLEEIEVPEELEDKIEQLPDEQKEPARQSLRFGVFLLTVGMVVVVNLAGRHVPVIADIPVEALEALTWQIVIMGLGFIGARTLRNKA